MNFKALIKQTILDENFGWATEEMCHDFSFSKGHGLFHQHLLPLDKVVGQAFLKAELYSQGLDFTHSWHEKKDHENRSYLKRIWKGEKNLSHHDHAYCWTLLKEGVPIGIAILEQTQQPLVEVGRQKAYEIGGFSVYLTPSFRNQGLMKALVNEQITPVLASLTKAAHQLDATPFIGAEDAASRLLLQSSFEGEVIPFHHATPERAEYLKNVLGKAPPNIPKKVLK